MLGAGSSSRQGGAANRKEDSSEAISDSCLVKENDRINCFADDMAKKILAKATAYGVVGLDHSRVYEEAIQNMESRD